MRGYIQIHAVRPDAECLVNAARGLFDDLARSRTQFFGAYLHSEYVYATKCGPQTPYSITARISLLSASRLGMMEEKASRPFM